MVGFIDDKWQKDYFSCGNTKHWNHPKTYGISQKCPKWAKISQNEPKIYWNDPKSLHNLLEWPKIGHMKDMNA